ncbi:cytochrome P450 [Tanacetum coccineum]
MDLRSLLTAHDSLSIVLGDFNEVRSPCERMGSSFCQRGADLFNEFISTSGLVEPPLCGMRYMRMNSLGSKLSKLDHFLVSSHLVDLWPNSHALALAREFSDHSPIILCNSTTDFGPVPFKFYNSWIGLNDLKPIVQAS